MSKKDDGGPAFPCAETQYSNSIPGMTLRDWFAGQYLISMGHPRVLLSPQEIAEECYNQADAMLAERSKE